ncbi:glycosyltransferase family 2 protein [Rhizobium mongolense]|uniref:Glycosyltransferase involved in cell wall biosynthesis n=2 Tax=Rhizobium mongolense TaxID=57676 RepID=A0ABR6IIF1_9HYPH|nr:glycosyltransferase [Rhizobium mongolense]MBB4227605.1 glycosyltransferase involved in cell wall biosynthesis [Rhizobium mongolense]TVZ65232.1 GT2 family glycosyltransferase [Rhizobium mongolense USDA 1844]
MPPRPVDISLIISSRNRAYGLLNCLDAIATAARQASHLRLELVFVDNGSSDDTSDVFSKWAASAPIDTNLIYETLPGLANARNTGIAAATGRILAFTDDDCEVFPDYFTAIEAVFADDTEIVMRGGRVELGDARDLPVTIKTELEPAVLTSELHAGGFIHGCNMAFPKALCETIGLFDPLFGAGSQFRSGEDTDYIHRASNAGIRVEYFPDLVVKHFHGRRKIEDIHHLHAGYAFGNGALYAKYMFDRRSNMRGMLRWDIRQAFKELIGGRKMSEEMGLTYRRQLRDNITGMLAYWRSAKRTAAPTAIRR